MGRKVTLRAHRALRYATRRLSPGDVFEASYRDARLLLATKKVREVREPVAIPAPPAELVEQVKAAVATSAADDTAALRAEYLDVVGRQPFMGWGAAELRRRIEAAKANAQSGGSATVVE